MTTQKAIDILETYRLWSNGEGRFEDYKERFPFTKAELNGAVEKAIENLKVYG